MAKLKLSAPNYDNKVVFNKKQRNKNLKNLISIVIPSYNGEKYIKETIESIQKQHFNHEIIVIDDISTDNTADIAKSMGCKVIVNAEHKGQMAGKNIGIREAKGDYWLTIDQDDLLMDNALQMLFDEMQKDENTKIIMAKLQNFCSPDTPEQAKFVNPKPFYGILTGSTLFKKEVFDSVGFFREDTITGDVIDLTERLEKHGITIKKADFITCHRRIHKANYSITNQVDGYKNYATILRDKLKSKI